MRSSAFGSATLARLRSGVFVDGEREILPGIRVVKVGGHTAGMQIVTVQTGRGQAVLASDASHYYGEAPSIDIEKWSTADGPAAGGGW